MPHHRPEAVVIIGSGVIGLTHALTAHEAGCRVTVIERNTRPLGASIRNFGTIWPIGLAFGPEREQALLGSKRWRDISKRIGIVADPCGSLSLAYREEAWSVLREFSSQKAASEAGFELLSPGDAVRRYPLVNPGGLLGAVFSQHEICLRSADALTALVHHLQALGVVFEFETCAIKVHEDAVEVADGRVLKFDRCVIAAGEELRILFPEQLAKANIRPCRLQMMRSAPFPQRLGAIMVSDLTLAHYPAFKDCPSLKALQQSLDATAAEFQEWGIHVIAAQHSDNSLTLGDSHEYSPDFTPEHWEHVDDLVLKNLSTFTRLPGLKVASRWQGVYLKSTVGQTQVVLQPRERVTMVTAMGGLGMTLSWGLAERTVASWELQPKALAS